MNADRLLAHFEQISEAPDAIARLRRFILDLAVRGKLVEQDPEDEPAVTWLLQRLENSSPGRTRKPRIKTVEEENDEVLTLLPETWLWVVLDDLIEYMDSGWSPQCEDHPRSSMECWGVLKTTAVQSLSFDDSYHKELPSKLQPRPQHEARACDILITRAGPKNRVGISCVIDKVEPRLMISDKIIRFRVADKISPRFVALALNTGRSGEAVEQAKTGMAVMQMNISQVKLRAVPIPLPPLAEQHRIVAKVDELMALCDQLEAARQQREQTRERLVAASLQRLNQPSEDPASFRQHAQFALQTLPSLTTTPAQIKQLRQTILNLAVRGKLVEQDPEDEPAEELLAAVALEKMTQRPNQGGKSIKPMTVESDEINLFPVRLGWVWTTLEDYALDVSTGPFGSMLHQSDYIRDGVPVINPSHMIGGRIHPDPKVTVPSAIADKLATYKLRAGDVVMARRGEVGRAAHVSSEEEGWLCGTGSFIVRFIPEIPREYVLLFLSAGLAREYLLDSAVGSTMTNLNHGILKHMPIPLPPLAEQHRIVAKVDELMAVCDQLEQQLSQADQLRRWLLEAVLAEALDGRLAAEEESHADAA